MSNEGGLQRQFYEMLMDSQWWSADQLRNHQRSQLSQLLHHAKANVPFYEHRLDAVLMPSGDIDWNRWRDIPIVRRQDLAEHRSAMQATQVPPGHGATESYRSSGSTGTPIEITVNGLVTLVNTALRWRYHSWNSLSWAEPMVIWQLDAQASPGGIVPLGPWGPKWSPESTGVSWGVAKDIDTETMASFLTDRRSAYVNRGPKAMHVFALDCERLGLRPSFDAILCQGEACDESDREAFHRVFGARAVELYSAKESGHIAHPCEHGSLHLAEEAIFVELLNEAGDPCEVGETGHVTVTPLYFTAQPVIRYQLGDMAEYAPPCACGRKSRVLGKIHGRSTAIFSHPDGRAILRFLPASAKGILQCGPWQLAQTGPLEFEMRYVPMGIADEIALTVLFKETFFPEAQLRFLQVERIQPQPSGKYLEYVNEYAGAR